MFNSGCTSSFAKWICLSLALALALFSAAPTRAQVSGATLSGLVTDENGGPVPDAAVTIKNVSTGVARELVSNADGFYSAPNLLPGSYEVKVAAKGFQTLLQKEITLTVGAQQSLNLSLKVGQLTQTVEVNAAPPDIQTTSSTISATVDSITVRQLPLNGRDWTSLATLEPGVVSIPNQATTSFSANKGNRGFGNQLSNGGHRANENSYRVNGVSINDYSNSAPGGATGVNLGVDAVQEFSVLTSNYTADYGRTSGAVINAITKSGTNDFHGTGFFFDRDSIFDARNFFDKAKIAPFRRIQFGASGGTAIIKNKTFVFANYEGIRQSASSSGTIHVPSQEARNGELCVPSADGSNPCVSLAPVTVSPLVVPYLALWPCPASCQNATNTDAVALNSTTPNHASENYFITRIDHRLSAKDSLSGSYFFDSGPQSQTDPLGNTVHEVFSRRQLATAEDTHIFGPALANTLRAGFSRLIGNINTPVSGDAVATDTALAIAPGAIGPPQIPISGITTAFGLGGFNKFKHAFNSIQLYDDAFYTHGTHSIKFGFAFERMQYNILEQLSPNGRMNNYLLGAFLTNAPHQLNALAPGGSFEVGLRQSIFAGYIQDDWRFRPNLTFNIGLRYEATTRPTDSHTVPGYTVNGYTVATAGFQEIQTLVNCTPDTTACGPVGTSSPISNNPTTKNFEPRIGLSWDPRKDGKTAVRAGFGIFDVLPLPYEFGLNTAATAPFQIIGNDKTATLGTGTPDANLNFNRQNIRNRMIDPNPHRADVLNWNLNIQHEIANGWTALVGYVGSRSVHLSVASDDINLVQPSFVSGVGLVFPCDPTQIANYGNPHTCADTQTGTRIDSNWGGGAGIRPVIFDGAASYSAFQSQIKKASSHGVQGQASYTFGKCRDTSSAPVTGDTYLNSIAVPLLLLKSARVGACDFDIRQTLTGTVIWDVPGPRTGWQGYVAGGWQIGAIVTASTGAPYTVTVGDGNDPLGTGFNGDFSMNYANLIPGCNATPGVTRDPGTGAMLAFNRNCFTPPTAPASLPLATAANPFGCAPLSYTAAAPAPAGLQYCSNVLGTSGRNKFYGPGLTSVDFSIFKNFPVPKISETFNAQFRAEFFNVLNHSNFLSPGFLNTFGQNNSAFDFNGRNLPIGLNQTSTTSRQIQLGLKLVW